MLSVSNLSVQFGKRILFDEVNTAFNQGNCYGIIGANGAGKSTFLKILAGKQDPTSGHVSLESGKRMSVFEQEHNLYDEHTVLETVLMGNKPLFKQAAFHSTTTLRNLCNKKFGAKLAGFPMVFLWFPYGLH